MKSASSRDAAPGPALGFGRQGPAAVITGSTRGLALAQELLERSCRVTVSGRTPATVQAALERLGAHDPRVHGLACDVTDALQVQALWEAAAWRCVEGGGSNGMRRRGLAVYGSSKCAVRYFTLSLADEAAGTPVLVGTLSPGMMATEFLTGPMGRLTEGEARRLRGIVNIFGDHPQTVARYLVARILANRRHRARFAWLTGARAMGRFLTAGLRRRELFAR